jgi:hypothetical protein
VRTAQLHVPNVFQVISVVKPNYYKKVHPGSESGPRNILPFTFNPLVLNPLVFSTRCLGTLMDLLYLFLIGCVATNDSARQVRALASLPASATFTGSFSFHIASPSVHPSSSIFVPTQYILINKAHCVIRIPGISDSGAQLAGRADHDHAGR